MKPRPADASRDNYLTLRRVERQQAMIERLSAARGQRVRLRDLAHEYAVSTRTVARDVERLRLSGVPLEVHRGRGGGVSVLPRSAPTPISFDLPEVAALLSSLTAVGPSVSASAASAMRKLASSLAPVAEVSKDGQAGAGPRGAV